MFICVCLWSLQKLSHIFTLGARSQMHIMCFIMCNSLKVGTAHGCTHRREEVWMWCLWETVYTVGRSEQTQEYSSQCSTDCRIKYLNIKDFFSRRDGGGFMVNFYWFRLNLIIFRNPRTLVDTVESYSVPRAACGSML